MLLIEEKLFFKCSNIFINVLPNMFYEHVLITTFAKLRCLQQMNDEKCDTCDDCSTWWCSGNKAFNTLKKQEFWNLQTFFIIVLLHIFNEPEPLVMFATRMMFREQSGGGSGSLLRQQLQGDWSRCEIVYYIVPWYCTQITTYNFWYLIVYYIVPWYIDHNL